MNFKKLKKLVILAVSPIILSSGNHVAFAGGGASTMRSSGTGKQRSYSVSSSEKRYATHDMSRIVYKTFNYTQCDEYDNALLGPWRFMAYKKVEHDPKFKDLIPHESLRHLEVYNLFRELAAIKGPEEFVPMTVDDPDFKYMYHVPTENEDFEKVVEECRKEWNLVHDYKEIIRTPKEALEKALRVLKPACADRDPFANKSVEVSYDPIKRIYRIQPTTFIDKCICRSVLLSADGEVISIDCEDDYLRKLV